MAWDETLPADNEAMSQGASRIRSFKADIADALQAEGSFPVNASAPKFYFKLNKDTNANRPAASSDYPGRLFLNSTYGSLQRVKDDGSGWEDVIANPSTTAIHAADSTSLASVAGVVTLDETSNAFHVSGTEAVTSITGWTKGIVIIRWTQARTITYNASNLILLTGQDKYVNAGDVMIFQVIGSGQVREIAGVTHASTNTLPTRQTLTSGTSATYTTPSGARQLRIRMVGGGGGGGARDTNDGASGSATIFNGVEAAGGGGGVRAVGSGTGPKGGAGGTGGAGSATFRCPGGPGNTGGNAGAASRSGGSSLLGGGAPCANDATTATSAAANTGGGGAGASYGGDAAGTGGGGEYVELVINNPAATYTYTIGAGGAGGAAGTYAGGAGGSGLIIVEEIY